MQQILQHLEEDYPHPIRDPIWKHIYLSDALLKIVSLPVFQDLNGIKQLGPAYLVYPGATHTRLSHSLGTFHVAKQIIHSVIKKDNQSAPLAVEEVKAFLCAALLHDLGHYPFAHALKNLDVEKHEVLTARLILEKPLAQVISADLGVDPELVAAIIDTDLRYKTSANLVFFRRLLSGVLDPDKLDYLNRDAYYCGVPYGVQDVDFFLSEIIPAPAQGIALRTKGLTAVEAILFSKYLMYKTVYWHKAVRIATAMIKKALVLGLSHGVLKKEDLYGLTDYDFYTKIAAYKYKPFTLISHVLARNLYKRVYTIPFDASDPAHRRLENVNICRDCEAQIAHRASKIAGRTVAEDEIIIDLPEPISFEIDLPLYDEERNEFIRFTQSKSVFSEKIVKGFTDSLRFISLICRNDSELITSLKNIGLNSIIP
ncbi:MAG: HD domain-containing protein [Spirochaetales bacterium]|nr:HD domain-containing protein [Spirochaetales bacterium]